LMQGAAEMLMNTDMDKNFSYATHAL
jgi:hypothetical protein